MVNIDETLKIWRESLCKQVDVGGLFTRNATVHRWKSPWRMLLLRESAAWRLIDLLSQSVFLHKNEHMLGARILLRSAFEPLALLIYSSQCMRKVVSGELDFHKFSEDSGKLLLGSRDKSTPIDAINVLTILQQADKRFPGLYPWYEALSESAHPNYEGMLHGYSEGATDGAGTTFISRWSQLYGLVHLSGVEACIVVFDAEYNHEWPAAFEALESWIEEKSGELEASMLREA